MRWSPGYMSHSPLTAQCRGDDRSVAPSECLLQRCIAVVHVLTIGRELSYRFVDLRQYRLQLTAYTLRHPASVHGSYLRHWEVQASNDGHGWLCLDQRHNDRTLRHKGQLAVFNIDINERTSSTQAFRQQSRHGSRRQQAEQCGDDPKHGHRNAHANSVSCSCFIADAGHFRVLQTGVNSSGQWQVLLGGVELFGRPHHESSAYTAAALSPRCDVSMDDVVTPSRSHSRCVACRAEYRTSVSSSPSSMASHGAS